MSHIHFHLVIVMPLHHFNLRAVPNLPFTGLPFVFMWRFYCDCAFWISDLRLEFSVFFHTNWHIQLSRPTLSNMILQKIDPILVKQSLANVFQSIHSFGNKMVSDNRFTLTHIYIDSCQWHISTDRLYQTPMILSFFTIQNVYNATDNIQTDNDG